MAKTSLRFLRGLRTCLPQTFFGYGWIWNPVVICSTRVPITKKKNRVTSPEADL